MTRLVAGVVLAIAVGAALAVLPPTAQPASAAATTFGVATARVNITPSALGFPTYYRAGYGSDGPQEVTSGQTLYATGMLLVNAAGQKWVIVSTDILGYPNSTTARLQAAFQTQFGIAPERVMLNATHTHGGPVLVDQPNVYITYNIQPGSTEDNRVRQYTTAFENRITSLVQTLVNAPLTTVSAKLSFGAAIGSINRAGARQTAIDPSVPVLTLRNTSNQRIVAVLFSYATHAVSAGRPVTWNRDFPGVAMDNIESSLSAANPGVRALYLRGPSGDQNPKAGFTTASLGQLIASQVVTASAGGVGSGAADVHEPEVAGFTNLQAPLDIRVNDAELRRFYTERFQNTESLADRNHAELMLDQLDSGTLRRAMTIQVVAWRFGAPAGGRPLALIGIAGEATVDFAAGFDTVLGNNYRPWTTIQTNGHPGYIPSDELLQRGDGCPTSGCFYGTYESGWTVVENGQRYPEQSATTYNDGLVAPLRIGVDNSICSAAATIITGGAGTDCTKFTLGRVIPHGALMSNTGPGYAAWTDSNGRGHIELLALGSNRCLMHRSWTGGGNGSLIGTWSPWDTVGICGGITGTPSAEAWVDGSGRARIELAVRTTDGSVFHGRCVGDATGCANKTWSWTQLGTPSDGFVDAPEISVWKQTNGFVRMDIFQVRSAGRCLNHRGFVGTDTNGNGSWAGWSNQPGCGGIVGPAGSTTWRAANGTVNHDVMVRTTNGSMFTVRCAGSEASCSWGGWSGIGSPSGGAGDAPTYSAAPVGTGVRFNLFVRGNDACIYQAGWTSATAPAAPNWRRLDGCGLVSSVGAVTWTDSFGRSRTDVAALNAGTNGPIWVRGTSSTTGNFNDDVVRDWEDIADPTMAVTAT
jgi:neutral ceramidase